MKKMLRLQTKLDYLINMDVDAEFIVLVNTEIERLRKKIVKIGMKQINKMLQ